MKLDHIAESKALKKFKAVVGKEQFEKGLAKGKAEGLRVAVLDLCDVLGIKPSGEQKANLKTASIEELEALREHIKANKAWPVMLCLSLADSPSLGM